MDKPADEAGGDDEDAESNEEMPTGAPAEVGGDGAADEGAKEKGGSRGMGNPGTVEPEEEEPPGAAGDDE